MPNPKLETYKNKATGTVYDYTDADAQGKLSAILDGTDIDSFSDVESALADKVDVVSGKGLSTNDYDDTEKAKVAGAFPRSEQAVLGAYNIINNTMETHEVNGVTFTVNADKAVSLSGTSTGDLAHTNPPYKYDVSTDLTNLKKGRYKLVGCPSGGSSSTYRLIISNGTTSVFVTDTGNGAVFDYDPNAADPWKYCYIRINSGQNMTGKVFKPMITTDLNATYDDYVAPAMTNEQLTENKIGVVREITSSDNLDNITDYGVYSIKSSPTNAPDSESYVSLLVTPCATIGSGAVVQTIFAHGHAIYSRTKTGNPLTWEPWYKFTGTVIS